MGRCKYEKLSHIEKALDQIRQFKDLKEPKPGIFYLKSQGFLHFHEKDDVIWADVKDQKVWGPTIEIPQKATKKFIHEFVREVLARYLRSGGT